MRKMRLGISFLSTGLLFSVVVAAHATMPALTPVPGRPTPDSCRAWAAAQSIEAIDMWGIKEDGSSSRDVAVLRLATSCMGGGYPEIVGFGSSAGFDQEYCARHPDAGVCAPQKSKPGTKPSDGFVFGSGSVVNPAKPSETLTVSERIGRAALKKRFSRYAFKSEDGEDCSKCAQISGPAGTIEVFWDDEGKTVTGVASRDKKSVDMFGNAVGTQVSAALGSSTAHCDYEMEMVCVSKVERLSYSIDVGDKCPMGATEEGKPTNIPSCAVIGGFRIYVP
jgi:hypothetical protein